MRKRSVKAESERFRTRDRGNPIAVRWFTTRIIRLNRFGEKRFTGRFPFGTTKAQAVVGKTPGYMPGFSVIKLVSR